jgi:protein HIRA/HIR1
VARPNGSPILSTTSGVTYSYDNSLCTFVKLSEPWWAEGSDAWSSRPRNNNFQQLVVASIENAISERLPPSPGTAQRPQWWTSALTLGHLESKLHAARVLDSSAEYKQTLLVYAKKIADEGFRNKAEELIKELFGPIYWSALLSHAGNGHSWKIQATKYDQGRYLEPGASRTWEERSPQRSPASFW